ncbi:MAG: D-glycerate dehydrogenase [Candidatus Thorarchaeota archaeon]|nr:D-glycerate dehydrogenase [Candidatus Thorarchaeota archaeon]
MLAKVFVTRKIPEEGLNIIKKECDAIVWEKETPPTEQEIIDVSQDCEGIVTLLSDPINAHVIESLPKLRVIAQYAVGYDNIDVEAATKKGILVTNTPGVLTETTADLAWALLMAASRRIVEADKYVRNGQWKVAWGPQLLLGRDIYDATIGIVGMGRIGFAVARRARGFGMKIIYTNRSESTTTKKAEDELGALRVDLDTLLEQSDFVSLHVPLTKHTRHLINRERLRRMKPTAVLINTARGPVVHEEALIEALQKGWIRAAGLDVFTKEPLSQDSPLISLPNVILAPHIGSASVETRSKMSLMCAENLLAGLKGIRPKNLVNDTAYRHV